LCGTIRDFDKTVFDTITKRLREVAHGTCAAYGATATITIEVRTERNKVLFPANSFLVSGACV
jgi:metal-dependent amidase/aminoacylase/carboxypeptidase family protein